MEEIKPTSTPKTEFHVGQRGQQVSATPKEEGYEADIALHMPSNNPELEIARASLVSMEQVIAGLLKSEKPSDKRISEVVEKAIQPLIVTYKDLLEASSFDNREKFLNTLEVTLPYIDTFVQTAQEYANDEEIFQSYIDSFAKRTLTHDD